MAEQPLRDRRITEVLATSTGGVGTGRAGTAAVMFALATPTVQATLRSRASVVISPVASVWSWVSASSPRTVGCRAGSAPSQGTTRSSRCWPPCGPAW